MTEILLVTPPATAEHNRNMEKTRVLVIRYGNRLSLSEIPLFRGAVIGSMGGAADGLYHNHSGDGVVYRYPLIQYKRIGGCAAIVAVDSGADIIGQFLSSGDGRLRIGEREEEFTACDVRASSCLVQVWDGRFDFHLRKWLPFNSKNFAGYGSLDALTDKIDFLEHILVGNILSFAKGVGVTLTSDIVCKITSIEDTKILTYKGVKMTAFDIEFSSNVSLPDYVGLGKGASLGFGTVNRIRRDE